LTVTMDPPSNVLLSEKPLVSPMAMGKVTVMVPPPAVMVLLSAASNVSALPSETVTSARNGAATARTIPSASKRYFPIVCFCLCHACVADATRSKIARCVHAVRVHQHAPFIFLGLFQAQRLLLVDFIFRGADTRQFLTFDVGNGC